LGTLAFFLLRETSASVLIHQKARRLRKETGEQQTVSEVYRREPTLQLLARAFSRPLKLLMYSPIVLLVSLYTGIMFGLIFLLFTTFPLVFGGTYGFNASMSGLVYLGLGIGMTLGLVLFSALSDKLLGQKEGVKRPEDRLILMKWIGPITPLGLFMYGWSAEYKTHWIVPILGTFILGLGALFIVIPGQLYLVDAFGAQAAASALAANMLVRSPFGAFLDLAAEPLYRRLGLGWGNSVLGFICVAFTPVPWIFHYYGERLRASFTVNL
jgi:MFS family permease